MSDQEDPGFVVRDKRGHGAEEASVTSEPEPEPASSPASTLSQQEAPPLTFSSFIFSLGTSTLMLMGESMVPDQPTPPANLPQAKEMIDVLSMLEAKTQGNLTSDEQTVLHEMLYTLRMKYVDAVSGKS